jgi:hypothetical protein
MHIHLEASVFNPLFQHEYGHYLESQASGWDYLTRFAIPSAWNAIINNGTDLSHPVEQDAQARALLYFTKNVKGFTYNDWKYIEHPFYDHQGGSIVTKSRITQAF